jgi:hypothetical protein
MDPDATAVRPWTPAADQWSAGSTGPTSPADPPSAGDPLFPDDRPSWQPRIEPSPPGQNRLGLGLLIGLLAGLLVFGSGGYLLRMWTGESGTPVAGPTPTPAAPTASASLPPYEASQLKVNQDKFGGALAPFAESWLPWMGNCAKNGEPGGPRLARAERTRVFCEVGGLNVFFVEYTSIAERDKARLLRTQLNIDARQLTPGAAPPVERTAAPSGDGAGGYVEYAFREGSGAGARVVASVWWDRADAPVAGFLQGPWTSVGESWEPIRDVWRRHA